MLGDVMSLIPKQRRPSPLARSHSTNDVYPAYSRRESRSDPPPPPPPPRRRSEDGPFNYLDRQSHVALNIDNNRQCHAPNDAPSSSRMGPATSHSASGGNSPAALITLMSPTGSPRAPVANMSHNNSPVLSNATVASRDPRLVSRRTSKSSSASIQSPVNLNSEPKLSPSASTPRTDNTTLTLDKFENSTLVDSLLGYLQSTPELAVKLFELRQAEERLQALEKEENLLKKFGQSYVSGTGREQPVQMASTQVKSIQMKSRNLEKESNLYAYTIAKQFDAVISSSANPVDAPPACSQDAFELLQDRVNSLQTSFESALASRDKQIDGLKQLVEAQTQTVASLQEQLQVSQLFSTNIADLQREIKSMKQSQVETGSNAGDIRPLLQDIKELKAESRQHIVKIDNEKTLRREEEKKLLEANIELVGQIDRLTQDSAAHSQDILRLDSENAEKKKKAQGVETNIDKLLVDSIKYEYRIARLSSDLTSERQKRGGIEADIKKLQTDSKNLEDCLKTTTATNSNDLAQLVKNSSASLVDVVSRVETLERASAQAPSTGQGRKDDMQSLKEQVEGLQKLIPTFVASDAGVDTTDIPTIVGEEVSKIMESHPFNLPSNTTDVNAIVKAEVCKAMESLASNATANDTDMQDMVMLQVKKALETSMSNQSDIPANIRAIASSEVEAALEQFETAIISVVRHQVKGLMVTPGSEQGSSTDSTLQTRMEALSNKLQSLSTQVAGLEDIIGDDRDPGSVIAVLNRQEEWITTNGSKLADFQKVLIELGDRVEKIQQMHADVERLSRAMPVGGASVSSTISTTTSSISMDESIQKLKEEVKTMLQTLESTYSDLSAIKSQNEAMTRLHEGLREDLNHEISQHKSFVGSVDKRFQEVEQNAQILTESLNERAQNLDVVREKLKEIATSSRQPTKYQSPSDSENIRLIDERMMRCENALSEMHKTQARALVNPEFAAVVTEQLNSFERRQGQLNERISRQDIPQSLHVHRQAIASLEKRFDNLMTNELAQQMLHQLRQSQGLFDAATITRHVDELRNGMSHHETRIGLVEAENLKTKLLTSEAQERLVNLEVSTSNSASNQQAASEQSNPQTVQDGRPTMTITSHFSDKERLEALENNVSLLLHQLRLPDITIPDPEDPNKAKPKAPLPILRDLLEKDLTIIQQTLDSIHKEITKIKKRDDELRLNQLKKSISASSSALHSTSKGLNVGNERERALPNTDTEESSDQEPLQQKKKKKAKRGGRESSGS
jgi:hypothetical protein